MAEINSYTQELEDAAREYTQGNYSAAFKKYLKLAEEGSNESQFFIGWMYEQGIGTSKNSELAKDWFKRSANLGSLKGSFYYALYLIKNGEYEEAFSLIKDAALQGDIPSNFRLGYMYIHGQGTKVDLQKGLHYLKFAAENNHIYAMRELTILDMKGHRGLGRWILAPIKFVYVVCLGVMTAIKDEYSESLRR